MTENSDYKVLICNSQTIWESLDKFPEDEKYFLADDGENGFQSPDFEEFISCLHKGIFISKPITKKNMLNYNPPCGARLEFIGGYFGRPAMPVSLLKLTPLDQSQISRLEEYLFTTSSHLNLSQIQ